MDERTVILAGLQRRVLAARKNLDLSFRKAEQKTGVPFNTISRIEKGEIEPSLSMLQRLAKGYGVTLKSLLCGE